MRSGYTIELDIIRLFQKGRKERKSIYIVPFWPRRYTQSAQAWITQFYLQIIPCLPFFRVLVLQVAKNWATRVLNISQVSVGIFSENFITYLLLSLKVKKILKIGSAHYKALQKGEH